VFDAFDVLLAVTAAKPIAVKPSVVDDDVLLSVVVLGFSLLLLINDDG
jgi:hypothetical protein